MLKYKSLLSNVSHRTGKKNVWPSMFAPLIYTSWPSSIFIQNVSEFLKLSSYIKEKLLHAKDGAVG